MFRSYFMRASSDAQAMLGEPNLTQNPLVYNSSEHLTLEVWPFSKSE